MPKLSLLDDTYIDFDIALRSSGGLRRWIRPQVHFFCHGQHPFMPLPEDQSLPLMEWGLNWCVSHHYNEALVIHAAVVEKFGKALILPGQPGAGKSTLCAALVTLGGFRLLSDELTLLDLQSGCVLPNPRPVSLKNQAIEIVRSFAGDGAISRVVHDTQKGTVGLLQPPPESLRCWEEPAKPGAIVFPRFKPDIEGGTLQEMSKGLTFLELANHSFNYSVLAEKGFHTIARHLDDAACFAFEYDGNLNAAVEAMEDLLSDV